jgi:DNA-binding CsgD family transcriptional regulator
MRDAEAPLLAADRKPPANGRRLAPAEAATLKLVAAGLTTREIAVRRGVSVEGVRSAIRRCQNKIGVIDLAALLHNAYRTGLLPAPERRGAGHRPPLEAEQQRLLRFLAVGATTRQIGSAIYRSRSTVQTRLSRLRVALGADTYAQAVHLGWQYGYLDDEPKQNRVVGDGGM